MKTAMNMLLWTTVIEEKHYPLFADLKSTGYDGVELFLTPQDASHYAGVRRELDAQGLGCTVVSGISEEANPASDDANVRAAAVDYLKWAIDTCAVLGSDVLCGPFHSAYASFAGRGPTDDEIKWSADVLAKAAEHGAAAGVNLSLEFLNRFECYLANTVAQTNRLIDQINHPNVSIHYDTHHAHIEEKNATNAIRACGDRLGHVHLSECDRGTPGTGQIHWEESFKALHAMGYDGWLVIEAFSRLDPEFAGAIHIYRDLFPSPEQVYQQGYEFITAMWEKTRG